MTTFDNVLALYTDMPHQIANSQIAKSETEQAGNRYQRQPSRSIESPQFAYGSGAQPGTQRMVRKKNRAYQPEHQHMGIQSESVGKENSAAHVQKCIGIAIIFLTGFDRLKTYSLASRGLREDLSTTSSRINGRRQQDETGLNSGLIRTNGYTWHY